MRKLIFKSILLLMLVQGLFFTIVHYGRSYFMPKAFVIWNYQKEVIEGDEDIKEPEIVFLGGSRLISGIDPHSIPNSRSLCLLFASSLDCYFTLNHYLQNHPSPTTIFISIEPYRFMKDDKSFWSRSVGYDFLSLREVREIGQVSDSINDHRTIRTNFNVPFSMQYLIRQLHLPLHYQANLRKGILNNRYQDNKLLKQKLREQHGFVNLPSLKEKQYAGDWLMPEAKFEKFQATPLFNHYMIEILELCETKQIQNVIFKTMPINQTSHDNFQKKFLIGYQQYIASLSQQYPHFVMDTTIMVYPDSLYGNPSHLNPEGARLYTEELKTQFFNRTRSE